MYSWYIIVPKDLSQYDPCNQRSNINKGKDYNSQTQHYFIVCLNILYYDNMPILL